MRPKELLLRFRPTGTPGPAGRVGVPTSAADGPEVELGPVFRAMSATLAECEAIEATSDSAVAVTIAEAEHDAARLLATARSRAEAERGTVVAETRRAYEQTANDVLAEYKRQAIELESRGEQAIDAVVREAIKRLLEEFGLESETTVRS